MLDVLKGLGRWNGDEKNFGDLIYLLRADKLVDMYTPDGGEKQIKAYCQFLRYVVVNVVGKYCFV